MAGRGTEVAVVRRLGEIETEVVEMPGARLVASTADVVTGTLAAVAASTVLPTTEVGSAEDEARPRSVKRGSADMGAFITVVVRVLFRAGRSGGARDLVCGMTDRNAATSIVLGMSGGRAPP